MENRDWSNVDQATETLICTLEKHALMKISALIDGDRFDEARQVADILREVGGV